MSARVFLRVARKSAKSSLRLGYSSTSLSRSCWASWCQPCVEEIPSLNQLQKELGPKGLVVLGVSVDKNEANYKKFLKRARISFSTSLDKEANVSSSYGTFKYPETYIISPDGKVLEKIISNRNWVNDPIYDRLKGLLSR